MSRSTRVRMERVWHHVTARGIDRRAIFCVEEDHRRFLSYLEKLPDRFGFKIHGYVLMGNHYHLLIEDPELQISEGIHWLNVCYGMSFNRREGRVGPVFQGRFKGVVLDPQERGLSVSRYVHLNPVRVSGLGLNKRESRAIRAGKRSDEGIVERRLKALREYPWSSYRAYVGLDRSPKWLTTEFVLRKAGGKGGYRKQVEKEIREGMKEKPWEEVKWGLVLAGEEIRTKVKQLITGDRTEERSLREKERDGVGWDKIVEAVEVIKGEKWAEFRERHGDWGRNMVWKVARERGRYKLREIGEKSGVAYPAVGMGLKTFEEKVRKDEAMKKRHQMILKRLNIVY